MSDIVILENGLAVDPDSGEFVDVAIADIDDALKFTALRRHEAKAQEDAYKAYRVVLDQVLIANQVERRTVYGELDVSVKSGSYHKLDTDAWRDAVSHIEMTRDELLTIVLAGTAFSRDALPSCVLPAFDAANKTVGKKPWIESRVVRKPAPKLTRSARTDDDLADWEATLAQVKAEAVA